MNSYETTINIYLVNDDISTKENKTMHLMDSIIYLFLTLSLFGLIKRKDHCG